MPDPLNNQAAMALLQAAQWLNTDISQLLTPVDLTLQQLKILSIIAFSTDKKTTVNQIKQQMIDPNSNVSRLLNKLMQKQLIEKRREVDDQRVVYIHITSLGINKMRQGKKYMDQGMSVLSKLTATLNSPWTINPRTLYSTTLKLALRKIT